jgi:hypothetical protein
MKKVNFFIKFLNALKPRTRSQIKNKFRKEEKDNPIKVSNALKKFDPKKLIKIIAIFKKFKEENKIINKKKTVSYRNRIDKEIDKINTRQEKPDKNKNQIDFKKIFQDIEMQESANDIKDELDQLLEDVSNSSDSDKTVSVINQDDLDEREENQKQTQLINSNAPAIQIKPLKTSKDKIIINEIDKNIHQPSPIPIVAEDISKFEKTLSLDFLKNFNN